MGGGRISGNFFSGKLTTTNLDGISDVNKIARVSNSLGPGGFLLGSPKIRDFPSNEIA